MSVKTLLDMGVERVSHIVTGFKGWKEAGYAIDEAKRKPRD